MRVYRIVTQRQDGSWAVPDSQARHYVKESTAKSAMGNMYSGVTRKIQVSQEIEWEDL